MTFIAILQVEVSQSAFLLQLADHGIGKTPMQETENLKMRLVQPCAFSAEEAARLIGRGQALTEALHGCKRNSWHKVRTQ